MSEPLTEDKLREYEAMACCSDDYDCGEMADIVLVLVDEVARLKAREADLVADFAMRNITAQLVLDHELGIEEETP